MGRQTGFYMDTETEENFIKCARQIGYKILYEVSNEIGRKFTKELLDEEKARKYGIHFYFYKEEYGKLIYREFDNSIHFNSPVVEVTLTPIIEDKKEIKKGRIWIDSNREFPTNDLKELFIKDYNRLVRWIRKNLPRQEYEMMGYKYKDYMSDGIRTYEEMGYKYSG